MTRRKDPNLEVTSLNNDIDAFEEFETEGTEPAVGDNEKTASAEIFPDSEEDLPVFEEVTTTKQAPEAPRAPAPESPPPPAAKTLADELVELSPDVPVNLVAVVGKTTTTVGDLIKYRIGQVVDLGRSPGETVDVVANGRLIARGELVEMDGKMGVRILKMVR